MEGLGSGVQGLGFGVWISIFQVRSVGLGFQGPGAEIYLQDLASGLGMEVYSFFLEREHHRILSITSSIHGRKGCE